MTDSEPQWANGYMYLNNCTMSMMEYGWMRGMCVQLNRLLSFFVLRLID